MKGRGTSYNPNNRFIKNHYEKDNEYLEFCRWEDEPDNDTKTEYLEIFPKTIINKVESPDIGAEYSINPYQGCEHGCVYCYARGTHEYWGYSAGLDFERKILVKKKAPKLLIKELSKKTYVPKMIMISGNTDCYQPIENKLNITRQILEICYNYRNPVGIITKNSLLLRDLDILTKLNDKNLLRITLSITSLCEKTRRKLEPRTSSIKNKLQALKILSENGIAVNVNLAPIIPCINEHEIVDLVKTVAEYGAKSVMYILVRLNGHNGDLFTEWLEQYFPDRKEKVLNAIKACREGKLSENRFGIRMTGSGKRADEIKNVFSLAKNKFMPDFNYPQLNFNDFRNFSDRQLNLF